MWEGLWRGEGGANSQQASTLSRHRGTGDCAEGGDLCVSSPDTPHPEPVRSGARFWKVALDPSGGEEMDRGSYWGSRKVGHLHCFLRDTVPEEHEYSVVPIAKACACDCLHGD